MKDFDLINNTLDDLLEKYDRDEAEFIKAYPLTSFEVYKRIEKLAGQKLTANLELCKKAKLVSNLFHKNIK